MAEPKTSVFYSSGEHASIEVTGLTLCDPANLVEELLAVGEDDEDILAELLRLATSLASLFGSRDGEGRIVDLGVLETKSGSATAGARRAESMR